LDRIPFPKRERKVPTVFSYKKVFQIINHTANIKHKTIIMLIYSSGLRVSEITKLTADDIIRDKMRLKIRGAKGYKDRYTILSEICLGYLEKYYKAYKPVNCLFPGKKKDSPISIRAVQHAYYKAKENAGITQQGGIHCLRHSFATHCLETGMGIFQLQKFLGHKCLKTTLQYVQLQEENIIARSPLDVYVQKIEADS
jgi:integrase/recombinase XerD